MAATVTIDETNGSGSGSETAGITNANMGSADAANLVAATYPITAGANSKEKWQRFHLTDLGTSTRIQNLKVWASAVLATGATHKTNARTTSYGGAQAYHEPSDTDRSATYGYSQTLPVSAPASANLGIGGDLTGALSAAGYSDYLVSQIQTTGSAVAGTSVTMNFQYDEVA